MRVIFRLPKTIDTLAAPQNWPKEPLAYVEWYSELPPTAQKHHMMYRVRKMQGPSGFPPANIIPLSSIRQSCMLFPNFNSKVDRSWTTDNVLDKCTSFHVNNWLNLYTYKTVW